MIRATVENAMDAWQELAASETATMETDFAVNDLLEEIAGSKYMDLDDDPDPIYTTIKNLTNAERRRFLIGCEQIKKEV